MSYMKLVVFLALASQNFVAMQPQASDRSNLRKRVLQGATAASLGVVSVLSFYHAVDKNSRCGKQYGEDAYYRTDKSLPWDVSGFLALSLASGIGTISCICSMCGCYEFNEEHED